MRLDLNKLDLHFIINNQHIKLMRLQGGYRSWTIDYSYGLMLDIKSQRNMWHFPTFHRADVRRQLFFAAPDTLFSRIQAAAEWCQQSEYEFIKAAILDRLDEVEPLMEGWPDEDDVIALENGLFSPLEGGD